MAAYADQYDDFAVISSTLGVQDGRVCVGEASRGDIGCPTYAPYVGADGSISATRFVGDGSGLFNIAGASADRIVSGTTSMLAISDTGYISVTQSGVNTAYFHPSMGLVTVGVSSTGPVSATDGYFSGAVSIGSSTLPSYGKTFTLYNDGSAASAATGNAAAIIQSVNRNTNLFLLGSASNSQMNIIFRKTLTQDAASIQYFNSNDSLQFIGLDASGDGVAKEALRIQQGLVGVGVRRLPVANLEVSGTVSATRFVGDGSGLTGIASSSISLALDDLTDAATNVTNDNLFIGNGTGALNTGVSNTAIGLHAFASNTTGTRSTALGSWALTSNTTGGWNTAIGNAAMRGNMSGGYNTAVGQAALLYNPAGTGNTSIGQASMLYSTNGNYNTAVGVNTLNTLVYDPNSVISYTTAVGAETAKNFRNGERNVFVGSIAANVLTPGSYNLLIGANVAPNLTGGSGNLVLGSGVGAYAANIDNYLNISNTIVANMTSSASQRAKVGINVISPTSSFEVSGTVSATVLQVANTAPDSACASTSDLGKMRRNPTTGRMQVCR